MAEKSLWGYLRKNMKGRWEHVTRVENSVSVGMADVSYYLNGNNWIELKEVKKLPVRPTTGIKLGQWHENGGAQRHFLIKRRGWLLVRVNEPKRTYLIYNWQFLPPWEKKEAWNWRLMQDNAAYIWTSSIDFDTLETILAVR
jgi:hypothetical protein